MALLKSTQSTNGWPAMSASGANGCVPVFGDYALTGSEAQNDVIEMAPLPAGYVPVDLYVDAEDCGTTFTLDIGVLTGKWRAALDTDGVTARVCGNQFANDKALGTAGVYRADAVGFSRIAPVDYDRAVGFKVDAAVAGLTAAAKIRLVMTVRPAVEGV